MELSLMEDPRQIVEMLGLSWERAVTGHDLSAEHPDAVYEMQGDLAPLASAIDITCTAMVQRRRVVERMDPWRFGLLLAFLEETVVTVEEIAVTRFMLFQKTGFWSDRAFSEWADEATGVARSTWQNWKGNARRWLLSRVGQAYLGRMEMTPKEFVRRVSMDKALRAGATMARGLLQPHHLEALADEEVSSEGMRRALQATEEQWEAEQEERERLAQEWVALGDGTAPRVEFDPGTRTVRLLTPGDSLGDHLVARFPVPVTPLVDLIQQEMLVAAKGVVK